MKAVASRPISLIPLLAALAIVIVLMMLGETAAKWAFDWPRAWALPAARWIGGFVKWLTTDAAIGPISFSDLTRLAAAIVDVPYQIVLSLLSTASARAKAARRR